MKKLLFAAVLASGLAFGQTKKVTDSNVQWWGYKLAKTETSSHFGLLNVKSGEVVLKNNQVAGGTFVLDMNSINATDVTGESKQKLDGHLKSGDFFETDKFPTAVYKITSVKKNNSKAFPYKVNGNLTVKGKTNAVSFPAKIALNNGVFTLTSDKFSFDRQKFGVNYKSSLKDAVIKDDIDMMISITAK
ncbi:YceI family protein [Chryseobacterium salipaludis]|uniref:YceI family protein n=1 Tax=Chryseobacterium TaxID=59732 RepID=UPI001FF4B976|nr:MULTISPECIES: YceI family protein [Chryseobacterium]MCJ8497950.1 YceI family protein [Chryseobacterium salipaludis]MCX3296851.1 YceI family protein [Planobacterium sp. JC490]